MALVQDNLLLSCGFIILGMIFDILDGLLARLLHSPSEIGKQLDSLADMVTFGLVPAFLYYNLAEQRHLGIIGAFLFIAAAAYRLAKFNLTESKSGFEGLPTPASTAVLVGLFIAFHFDQDLVLGLLQNDLIYIAIPASLAFFMVSHVHMFSLKEGVLSIKENPGPVLCVLVLVIMMIYNREMAVLATSIFYLFLSMILNLIKRNNGNNYN